MRQSTGIHLDEKSRKEIERRLKALPPKVGANAARAAIRAGAGVVRDAAKKKAPACISGNIKTVSRRGKRGRYVKSSVVVKGSNPWRGNSGFDDIDVTPCDVPIWIEMGTYGNRRFSTTEPYSPRTLSKRSYKSGKSDSPFWNYKRMWVSRQPFLRPALFEASKNGSIERAMAAKLKTYFDKYGV